ncbi:MAG: Gfo/Idh/MocA family oxidoreductase [bacterium]|nr:Gfo/Idh/MocA family oxidoreductase [bacterium]
MFQDKIRCGIVGLGFAGTIHIEKLSLIKGVEITDICDLDRDKIESAKDLILKLSGKNVRTHRSYEELLQSDIDAVFVATPAKTHYEIVKSAIQQRKHVFVEKPLVTSYEHGKEINDLAEKKGVMVQVGHVERFNSAYTFAKQYIKFPGYIRAERLSQFPGRGTDIDVIFDIMIHDIDAIVGFLKDVKIDFVESMGVPVITDKIDIATARIKFSSGSLAELTSSRVSYRKFRKMRIFQPGIYISIDFLERKTEMYRRIKNNGKFEIEAQIKTFEDSDPMRSEIEAFVSSLRNGVKSEIPPSEALKSVLIAEKIRESIFFMQENSIG